MGRPAAADPPAQNGRASAGGGPAWGLNAAFYVHHRGGGWRQLPLSFPPWQTVYGYVRRWKQDGTWQRLQAARDAAAHRAAGQSLSEDVARSAR